MTVVHKVEILRAACCVAAADGETADSELRLLTRLADKIGCGKASLDAMIEKACTEPRFCDEQFRFLKTKPDTTMKVLLSIALADNVLAQSEKDVLMVFGKRLGLSEDQVAKYLEAGQRHLDSRNEP